MLSSKAGALSFNHLKIFTFKHSMADELHNPTEDMLHNAKFNIAELSAVYVVIQMVV